MAVPDAIAVVGVLLHVEDVLLFEGGEQSAELPAILPLDVFDALEVAAEDRLTGVLLEQCHIVVVQLEAVLARTRRSRMVRASFFSRPVRVMLTGLPSK